MPEPSGEVPGIWEDALLAARVLAVAGPELGGIHLRARAGPVRDAWLSYYRSLLPDDAPFKRVTPSLPEGALIGGLDVAATLEHGKPIVERGLFARADGGTVVIAMAERAGPSVVAIAGGVLDSGVIRIERNGISAVQPASVTVVALDEGIDTEEGVAPALTDRMALAIDLTPVSWREADRTEAPTGPLPSLEAIAAVTVSDDILGALCAVALQSGRFSMRPAIFLERVARIVAALDGASAVETKHAGAAVRLVLPTVMAAAEPEEQEEAPPDPPENEEQEEEQQEPEEGVLNMEALQDLLVAVEKADLPASLDINRQAPKTMAARNSDAGKAGAVLKNAKRGRPIGVSAKPPFPGARVNVLATLRSAALWQEIRRRERAKAGRDKPGRFDIHKSDFRFTRFKHETESTAILVVDASGSTAIDRLGEAKGAAELLLAECYVRRDNVSLIAFRGREAELLLPPTRSLVRAKRSLAAVPGGGGTPLASGMMNALELALSVRRKGQSPLIVLLTDGSANIALDGHAGRADAEQDARMVAAHYAALSVPTVVIDIARRPRDKTSALARAMTADYHALPHANAHAVSSVVSGYMQRG
ncbi:magnesium chelatase subunit D [Rhodobium gokarnense]|uniref:Magnesium chelatase subunit D n=1 Tax=Rhodobium gokarnense TaxID=364296 RepID=A0ABT3HBU4_9HYPH|nr:magnesium chelatase subunit D [Rhodobium gokarnense]MCW2307756.1 magnesium chelatase subunit D [Rhodobium gokarnense]